MVDLVLNGGRGLLLVEVKRASGETWTNVPGKGWFPQVRKYLSYRRGPVVYLSTKRVPTPKVQSRRFLGHVYLEDLYAKFNSKRSVLSEIAGMFLELMEKSEMTPVSPFNSADLGHARSAFRFAKKCEGILTEAMHFIEPEFRKMFKSRTTFTSAHFSPTNGSAYSWSWLRRGDVSWISIWIEPAGPPLDFGVQIGVRRAKTNVTKLNRSLKWKEAADTLYTCHAVRSGMSVRRMVDIVLKDARKLRPSLA